MSTYTSDIAFTPTVKALQTRHGSRQSYARMEQGQGWASKITPELARVIESQDSFYIATTSKDGQPYIQHRGGPNGFLRILDESTLTFADFSGNRQYISTGNLTENNKVALFLMDYPNRRRIKIWGHAQVVEDDQELLQELAHEDYAANIERAIVITVDAWDVNCPQHITPKFTECQIEPRLQSLYNRIQELEEENESLRQNEELESN